MSPNLVFRRFLSHYSKIMISDKGRKYMEKMNRVVENHGKIPSTSFQWYGENYCSRITTKGKELQSKFEEMNMLRDMMIDAKKDTQLQAMVEKDKLELEAKIDEICDDLSMLIIPVTELDKLSSCVLEFSSGVGGLESGIFAAELMQMYQNYALSRGWLWSPQTIDLFEGQYQAIKLAVVKLKGEGAYRIMRFESGVHRVQRTPLTDPSRIHTSTASLIVLPESEQDPDVELKKDEILVQCIRNSGPGGQNVNKALSAVRITHIPTGIVITAKDERSQLENMKIAKQKLVSKLLEVKMDEIDKRSRIARKLQKIRTFAYMHDQVTDHRLNYQYKGVKNFLEGSNALDDFIQRLAKLYLSEKLEDTIEQELYDPIEVTQSKRKSKHRAS